MDYEPSGTVTFAGEHGQCGRCGAGTEWVDCWNGCDYGEIDRYEDDPMYYVGKWRYQRCDICEGHGGWLVCLASCKATV